MDHTDRIFFVGNTGEVLGIFSRDDDVAERILEVTNAGG